MRHASDEIANGNMRAYIQIPIIKRTKFERRRYENITRRHTTNLRTRVVRTTEQPENKINCDEQSTAVAAISARRMFDFRIGLHHKSEVFRLASQDFNLNTGINYAT
ncbi:hypothetical protein Zmor_012963 [Zophobas morio]|uniref:Uncharacterized protein n=1 Tax=Zophobas morio TaxID=2755281 RepID=A0AA38IGL3_9CUCU|nr:hypothetical protein Zmor_012963 [Zophobas morio]